MPKNISSPTKKVGEPKAPRVDRIIGQFDQPLLDVVLLRARHQPLDIDAGGDEGASEDLDIVHLLRLFPHVMIGGAEIRFEHALEPGRDGAAHQHQRVDGKERVLAEFRDVVAAEEALRLQRLIFGLVLDAAQRVARRHVAGRLVDSAKQDRHIFELHAGAPLDRRNHKFRQIGVRAAEIELKFHLQGICHRPLLARHRGRRF